MKKLSILIASLLLASTLSAVEINIQKGWQIVGSDQNLSLDAFDGSCVNFIWQYDNNDTHNPLWRFRYTGAHTYLHNHNEIINFKPNQGFWVLSNGTCSVSVGESVDEPDDNNTITHNGFTYKTVTSPNTGKVWLDRNLGATKVCSSFDDEACYGDYYQWGRDADGHEKYNSNTTDIQATDLSAINHSNFIVSEDSPFDWVSMDSDGLSRGTNWNPCPSGFRIPIISELIEENITDRDDAYSKLNLPSAGYRYYGSGSLGDQGSSIRLWSNTIHESNYTKVLTIDSTKSSSGYSYRTYGRSVRCIKDYDIVVENYAPVAKVGEDQNVTEGSTVTFDGSSSSDSDGSISSYEWKEGSTILSTSSSFNKSDLSIGTHTITLTVTDNEGDTDTDTIVIVVNEAITYSWIASPWSECSGSCGESNALQTRSVDCKSSNDLIVSDSYCTNIKPVLSQSCTASLCNSAPIADAGVDQTVEEGTLITFNGSNSTDSDGIISSYEWKEGSTTLSTSSSFNKSDFSIGIHTITLTVTDDKGVSDSDTLIITISGVEEISWKGLTYKTLTSPYTGRVWLDRNIGAGKVCTALDDTECFGDYYQWGRDADEHQKSNSSTTSTVVSSINPDHENFIVSSSSYNRDWTTGDSDGSLRAANWSKTDGSSVCPVGFKIPTETELSAETMAQNVVNNIDLFDNFLKIPSAGSRFFNGNMGTPGSYGSLWSSSIDQSNAKRLFFDSSSANIDNDFNAYGFSIRCIKDDTSINEAPVSDAGADQIVNKGVIVVLNGSSSSDSDGYISSYSWSSSIDGELGTGVNLSTSELSEGNHTITLTVTDDDGATNSDTLSVKVNSLVVFRSGETWNGLTYNTVTSPYTSRVWLDRNLGATQKCTAHNDTDCYGDYYQWGRDRDGHQISNPTLSSIQEDSITSPSWKFVIDNPDWTSTDSNGSLRTEKWSKNVGTSICPVGFRVPTEDELDAETISEGASNYEDAYNSFLKLPSAGYRNSSTGDIEIGGGYIWSSSASGGTSRNLHFNTTNALLFNSGRANGRSVRCIKDDTGINNAPTANAGSNIIVDPGTLISFDGSNSSDIDGTIISYLWNSDLDGELSTDVTFSTSELSTGIHTVTLAVTDDKGVTDTDTIIVTNAYKFQSGDSWKGVSYNVVTSPYTGRLWLDRNLGATQVCTAHNDLDCYGYGYQWGRNHDGHQEFNSSATKIQATTISPDHGAFISQLASPYEYKDWTSADKNGSLRSENWSQANGTSICPIGFRVPTEAELTAETIDKGLINQRGAFNSFIKIPSEKIWSSSVNGNQSRYLQFDEFYFSTKSEERFYGFSIRCIKDEDINNALIANAGPDQVIDHGESVTLDGSGSEDGVVSYSWSSDIDGELGTGVTLSSSNLSIGVHTITLTIISPSGASTIDTIKIGVNGTLSNNEMSWNGHLYRTITSPYTERVWLDRNLGAEQVCTQEDDSLCYGDYYQWGRDTDGHQKFYSDITYKKSYVTPPSHDNFIISDNNGPLWSTSDNSISQRSEIWSSVDGSSICPVGYRVPTRFEIAAETTALDPNRFPVVTNNIDAFNNFLKLPSSGYRTNILGLTYEPGMMHQRGLRGSIWTTSIDGNLFDFKSSSIVQGDNGSAEISSDAHITGHPVRCIKN